MPKNKGAGGNKRRRGKNESDDLTKRELLFKEDGQEYAQITKMLGGGKISAYCIDDVNRMCHIRGNMFKKVWLSIGDIILINIREYEKNVGDVIHKYLPNEIKDLKNYGELPESILIDSNTLNSNDSNNPDDVIFDDDNEDDS